jgi:hypothetical protein
MIVLIISLILIITLVTYTILSTKQTLTIGTTTSIVPTNSNNMTIKSGTTSLISNTSQTTQPSQTTQTTQSSQTSQTTQPLIKATYDNVTYTRSSFPSSIYSLTPDISNYFTNLNLSNVITISFTVNNITNTTSQSSIMLGPSNTLASGLMTKNQFTIFYANTTSSNGLYIGFLKNFYNTTSTTTSSTLPTPQIQQKFWTRSITPKNSTYDITIQLSNFGIPLPAGTTPLGTLSFGTWNNQVSKFCNISASFSYTPSGTTTKTTNQIMNNETTWYDDLSLKYIQFYTGTLTSTTTGISINNFQITIT